MTRDALRRLARLEAEAARRRVGERAADHGLSPEEYEQAHAFVTRVLSTHPTNWTSHEMEVMSEVFPQLGFGNAPCDPVA